MKAGSDFFKIAQAGAEQFRDRVLHPSSVRVELTVLGPDNLTRVPCGFATFPRADADVFSSDGTLTITAQDGDYTVKDYPRGEWTEATGFDANGHILYSIPAGVERPDDDDRPRKLTRQERLEWLADRGTDTHEEHRQER